MLPAWLFFLFLSSACVASAQWVAINDHAPGPETHVNATRYHIFANQAPAAGPLRNIISGTNLPVVLTITRTASGVVPNSSAARPAGGTPLSQVFYGYVDFIGSPDPSAEVAGAGVVTYTFSNLSTSMVYRLHGSAIRGAVDYTNRWALCEIVGAIAKTAAHSPGVLTTAQVPTIGTNQAALNSGANHTATTGDYVSWDNIRVGSNGTFSVTCRQYTGPVPGGTSNGSKGYALTGLRFEEFSAEETAPAIASQPADQTVFEGATAVLTADATGNPLFYQWLRNGVPIPGATDRVFSIICAQRDDADYYSFIVSNGLGQLASSNAYVSVVVPQIVEWGRNEFGQVTVPFHLSNVVMMAAGSWHGLALQANGKVIGWGRNDYGQISIPPDVVNPAAIAAGFYFSMALMPNGTVRCWGDNAWGQCNVPPGLSNVVMLAPGYDHALVLKADGTLVAWGRNNSGQLNIPPGLSNVVNICASGHYCLALKADGKVVAWGSYDRSSPVAVPANVSNIVAIAAANLHSLALRADGQVMAWGNNNVGQLNVPVNLEAIAIAAGNGFSGSHSVALRPDGTVAVWGYNNFNQSTLPNCLAAASDIAASEYYTMLLNAEDVTTPTPVVVRTPFIIGAVGRPLYDRFAIRNGPADVYVTGLPPELELEPATGLLTGLPVVAGTYELAISAFKPGSSSEASAVLIVQPNGSAPLITQHPQSRSAFVGDSVTLECLATGSTALRFQWYWNGARLIGKTDASLQLSPAQVTHSGVYRVFIDSAGGAAWSQPATLTVFEYPRFQTGAATVDPSTSTFRIPVQGLAGYASAIIEASTNLVEWQPVYTNFNPPNLFLFAVDGASNDPARFFRIKATHQP